MGPVASADDDSPPNTWITSGPTGTVTSSSVTFTFSGSGEGFQCRLDSTQSSAWSRCRSPQTYSGLADGQHTFEVRAVDDERVDPSPAVATFTVDTQPPDTTITGQPAARIASSSASFEFEGSEAGDSFECRLDSSDPSAWESCSSPQTYSGLADGPHTFEVRAVSGENVDPTPAVATFTVDTQPPDTTITSGPSGQITGTAASFQFTSSESGSSFECRLDSSAWESCSSPQTYSGLADGPHTFEVRARDAVGNVDPSPAVATFSIYTGPPPPTAGVDVDLEPVEGLVETECPGEDASTPLTSFKQVPVGCLVNTRNGVVNLTASKGNGELESSHFWGGVFVVTQETGENQPVDLKLTGKRMCERRTSKGGGKANSSRAGVRRLRGRGGGGRRLWGSGKGNYTTNGSYGSATVRGTTWLVIDRCDSSTLIKVIEGTVWVTDFTKNNKLIVLTAGEEYLAKALIPRLDPSLWH